MKKYLFTFIFAFVFCTGLHAQQERVQSLSVYAIEICSAWCGSNSGTVVANVQGGTPPYSYFWDGMPGSDTLSNLATGYYNVLVVDAMSDSAQSSVYVEDLQYMPFYVISIAMASPGMNNGAFQAAMYPSGMANTFPLGSYSYMLFDSTGFNLIEDHTLNYFGGFLFDPFYVFDSLPAGNYYLQGICPFGCFVQINLTIKTLPPVTPTLSTTDACNGTPTASLHVNLHPSPSINANTFNSNFTSTNIQGNANPVTTKYKITIADSVNNTVAYKATQDSLLSFTGLLPGNYTLKVFSGDTIYDVNVPNIQDSVLIYSAPFTIGDDPNCSVVKGRVFGDYNANCTYGFGDVLFAGTLVELNPGGYSSVTNASGEFFIPVVNGTYTLKQYAPYQFAQVCPDTNTFTINILSPGTIVDVQVADSVNVNPNIQAGITGSQPRPGFNHYYTIAVRNLTPNNISAQSLTFTYDTTLVYTNASPAPATNSGGVLTWNGIVLPPFGTANFKVFTTVPITTPLGTILGASALVTNVAGETITANNFDSISQTVSGSFDPNDKEVSPRGFDVSGYITATQQLKYTIRFQNTGTDTAFTVMIADTLPPSLNKYSLGVLNASHPFTYEFAAGNVVKFHFDNILLPDSNSNEPASHGYIKFVIDQLPGNLPATTLANNAAIYFDFNTPVITNTVVNTIFDCNQMATAALNNTVICENDSIYASSALLFPMNTEWFLDGTSISNDPAIYLAGLTAGNYSLTFTASNPVCSQSIANTIAINALPIQPFLTTIANTLQSSAVSGNQWLLSGVAIAGATATSYTPTASGFYSVMVTDANGCSNISDSTYVLITSINTTQANAIQVLPNPVKDELAITGLANGDHILTIYDAVGNVVLCTIVQSSSAEVKTTFAKGFYTLEIKKNNERLRLLKLIKE